MITYRKDKQTELAKETIMYTKTELENTILIECEGEIVYAAVFFTAQEKENILIYIFNMYDIAMPE